jgi:hypothetical protein
MRVSLPAAAIHPRVRSSRLANGAKATALTLSRWKSSTASGLKVLAAWTRILRKVVSLGASRVGRNSLPIPASNGQNPVVVSYRQASSAGCIRFQYFGLPFLPLSTVFQQDQRYERDPLLEARSSG